MTGSNVLVLIAVVCFVTCAVLAAAAGYNGRPAGPQQFAPLIGPAACPTGTVPEALDIATVSGAATVLICRIGD